MAAVCSDIPLYIDKKNKDGTSAAYYMNGDGLTAEEFCAPLIAPEPHCFEADIPDVWDEYALCFCLQGGVGGGFQGGVFVFPTSPPPFGIWKWDAWVNLIGVADKLQAHVASC